MQTLFGRNSDLAFLSSLKIYKMKMNFPNLQNYSLVKQTLVYLVEHPQVFSKQSVKSASRVCVPGQKSFGVKSVTHVQFLDMKSEMSTFCVSSSQMLDTFCYKLYLLNLPSVLICIQTKVMTRAKICLKIIKKKVFFKSIFKG